MNSRIIVNPEICGGEPCIRGTRIPVHIILSHLAAGEDEKTLNTVNSANEGLSKAYGFKSNIIGKTFMSRGQKHTIVEFKTRNRKYSIISECKGTGAKYKHTTSIIQSYLK